MYFNSVLHPATSPRADPIIDEVRFIPLTEVYQGCKRGPRSVSNLGSYLSERQAPELINMALFARLFGGDRSEVIEGPLDEWVAATIGSKAVATSNRHPHMGASESLHQVLANRMLKKYVTEFEAHCSPGNVGRMLSKIEPWRQKLSNYEKTDEARKASGGKRHGIERIVISANGAFIPESAMAGVSRDGKTLYINENYAHMVREEAELLGVDPEAVDVDTFLHEVVYHIIKKIKGNASGEKQIETEKRDFFKG